ncbi:MAG: AAA family ATPase, partial [Chloroflexi bacterium]|nr:AAA family ATPase [Chloroflexota bacterium]
MAKTRTRPSIDLSKFEISIPDLRWRCDPGRFKFDCTDELEPPSSFVGQDRAAAALEVGLGVTRPGFNIFVTGMTGTGRAPVIKAHLKESVEKRKREHIPGTTADWCYVFNFEHPDQPRALRFPGGQGAVFAGRVAEIQETLMRDLRNAFQSDAYQAETKRIAEEANNRKQAALREAEQFALERGFVIQMSPVGVTVIPFRDGKPLEQADFLALGHEERGDLERRRKEVMARVDETMSSAQAIDQERQEHARQLTQSVAEHTIRFPFEAIMRHYGDFAEVMEFFQALKEYTLERVPVFLSVTESQDGENPAIAQAPRTVQDPLLPFRVNIFVSHPDEDGAPIIEETNPTYQNLFGTIERRPFMGTYITDHTLLRAGAVVRASGGYLVVQAKDVLRQPHVWEALKRVLKGGQVRPEDPSEVIMPGLIPQGLRPEPIPIDLKAIMIGDAELYHLLSAFDEDFWEIFKVRADFDHRMENEEKNVQAYAALACGMVERHKLKHADRTGVAEIVEYGARIAGDRTKLSTRFGFIRDVLIEANYWADVDGDELIREPHVRKALEQRVFRTGRIADQIRELMVRGVLMVDLKGARVGQVNGLAVYDLGDISFG